MATIYVPPTEPGIDLSNASLLSTFNISGVTATGAQKYAITDGTQTINFLGTGFVYGAIGPLVLPVDGALTSLNFKVGTATILNWTGLNLEISDIVNFMLAKDTAGLSNLAFGGGDTYRLTNQADKVKALGGNDTVNANDGNDEVWGGAGRDQLNGGFGNDKLYGEAGNDKLSGGVGLDTLVGGGGNDQFIFTISGPTNKKTITDFTSGADKLVFDNAKFSGAGPDGPLSADAFALGLKAGDATDRFIYDQATGSLWYDRDGKGGNGQTLIADLQDGATLTASDFLII